MTDLYEMTAYQWQNLLFQDFLVLVQLKLIFSSMLFLITTKESFLVVLHIYSLFKKFTVKFLFSFETFYIQECLDLEV